VLKTVVSEAACFHSSFVTEDGSTKYISPKLYKWWSRKEDYLLKNLVYSKLSTILLLAFLLLVTSIPRLTFVKGEAETHDLYVLLNDTLKAPNHLPNGSSTIIYSTVVNNGTATEDNVALYLLINSSIQYPNESITGLTLQPNTNYTLPPFPWTPANGVWNVTVYAPPVSEESITTNNVFSKLVNVCPNEPPIASFDYSPKPPIMNDLVTFDASNSKDPDWGNITTYSWNFNGTTRNATVSIYNYAFSTYGNANVTLTLYDTEDENSSSTPTPMMVYARPVANFTINERPPYFVKRTLTFSATASYDPDNDTGPARGIAKYTWDFGDDNSTTTSNPTITHSYTIPKVYTVALNVTDYDDGLTSFNYSMLVSVGPSGPIASFTPPPQPCYVLHPLTFNATASYDPDNDTGPTRGIANYTWDFGDDNTTTVPYPIITHTYQTNGTYNVNLTVIDYDEGLTNSTNRLVNVSLEVFVEVVDSVKGKKDIVHDPKENFNVSITVANVVDLHSYEVNLTWPGARYPILEVTSVQSGGFLSPEDFEYHIANYQGYVWIKSSRLVREGASGNGTLAIITFHVNDTMTGNCTLTISNSLLKNSNNASIPHTPNDGCFYTRKPVANFTYSMYPSINKPICFNATTSYDPDNDTGPTRGIANYTWDFGDSNVTNTSDPIISHIYQTNMTYNVTLTVTESDEGLTWNFTCQVPVAYYIHDVAIIDVEPPPFQFDETTGEYETAGMLPINITVINYGTFPGETFNVTVYAMNANLTIEIGTITARSLQPGVPQNLTFNLYAYLWNHTYRYGDPLWDATYGLPKGSYTIIANVTWMESGIESDINPSNNNCTCNYPVRVYLAGDVDHDNKTDMKDIGWICRAYGSKTGDLKYNPNYDINCDGKIDMIDIGWACKHYGAPFGLPDP
jgi:PKD repeat protein